MIVATSPLDDLTSLNVWAKVEKWYESNPVKRSTARIALETLGMVISGFSGIVALDEYLLRTRMVQSG